MGIKRLGLPGNLPVALHDHPGRLSYSTRRLLNSVSSCGQVPQNEATQ